MNKVKLAQTIRKMQYMATNISNEVRHRDIDVAYVESMMVEHNKCARYLASELGEEFVLYKKPLTGLPY